MQTATPFVGGVVPVLVLGIHHVAVVAGGGCVAQVGGRVRGPGEDAQRRQEDQTMAMVRAILVGVSLKGNPRMGVDFHGSDMHFRCLADGNNSIIQ